MTRNRPGSDRGPAERLLAAIVESSDDAIISKTIDGVITSWNGGAERIFGYAADEMIGRSITRLAVPGREDEMPQILARIRRGERVDHFQTARRHKDGSIVLISLTVSPILDEEGRVIGASKVARDVTAAHKAEAALRQAEARLQEQHRALLHATRLGELGQMAATLAHEINQPLSAVTNYLRGSQRLLSLDPLGNQPRIEDALRRAADQAIRAGDVIRRLRSFAKPSVGRQAPVSIREILEDAASLATIDARQRGVNISLNNLPPEALVIADRIEIQQVLLNLIRNALEAMEGQARRELRLGAATALEMTEVAVSDTGPGLAQEVREHLFEPFVTTKVDGMGIGLSICRSIVENHGGRFWAEDNSEGGTTFRFTLMAA